uniref:Transposase Helix-turn-helix domain-containing protein n=1 Tax=Timema monikensis TaxID=170555 RepID=A0A7R9EGQ3_9NEOP|nr:unnamed protein product [Timema monikensis]
MSRSSFEELHALIQHRIHKEDTIMRQAIPTQERLAITLRYLASGSTLTDLHYSYKCGISTISGIVEENQGGRIEHTVSDVNTALNDHVDPLLSLLHPTSKPFLQSPDVLKVVHLSTIRGKVNSCSTKVQLISTSSILPEMFGTIEPIKSQNQPSQMSAHEYLTTPALYSQKQADSLVECCEEI